MKAIITTLSLTLILITFLCNNLSANWIEKENLISQQSIIKSVTDTSMTSYFKSNISNLKDESGSNIFSDSIFSDSLVLNGEATSNYFGFSVSNAGDVNGDGYSDIIVGAYFNIERAYIYFGGLTMDNIADVTLSGTGYFGFSVSTAGDVNRDGFSDVIVGQPAGFIGSAFIFYGGSSMNSVPDVTMMDENPSTFFGLSVSDAGDVNGDGYPDVIIGADFTDSRTGRAYIYFGSATMDNNADVILYGESTYSEFGWSVSTAGDVNNDGYSDVIVGADMYNNYTGKCYIFYGGTIMNNIADVEMTGERDHNLFGYSVSTAGDVNGDGYSDVIVGGDNRQRYEVGKAFYFYGGSSMNNVPDVIMIGEATNYSFGISVSVAGDVNGDGYSDVIVGSLSGKVYIFYGSTLMNNIADDILYAADIYYGFSVSSAEDINGDGYSDVIVGAYGYNSNRGRAYIYINSVKKPKLVNPVNNSINNPLTVNFKWKKLSSTMYFILKVATDLAFNNTIVNDTIYVDTSKTIGGFQYSKKYYWKVRAKDTSGTMFESTVWNFTTIFPIRINLKVLMEGMYYPVFNIMTKSDSVKVYLRRAASPYTLIDSAKGKIDSISLSNTFTFNNTANGTYYLVVKHFNSIETWSKAGGETLTSNGSIYNYDFSTALSQAYGNNLKKKGTKYCMFSGDVNQDGIIDGSDISIVENDLSNSVNGHVATDLNGDDFVDADDLSLVDNNTTIGVIVISP